MHPIWVPRSLNSRPTGHLNRLAIGCDLPFCPLPFPCAGGGAFCFDPFGRASRFGGGAYHPALGQSRSRWRPVKGPPVRAELAADDTPRLRVGLPDRVLRIALRRKMGLQRKRALCIRCVPRGVATGGPPCVGRCDRCRRCASLSSVRARGLVSFCHNGCRLLAWGLCAHASHGAHRSSYWVRETAYR